MPVAVLLAKTESLKEIHRKRRRKPAKEK